MLVVFFFYLEFESNCNNDDHYSNSEESSSTEDSTVIEESPEKNEENSADLSDAEEMQVKSSSSRSVLSHSKKTNTKKANRSSSPSLNLKTITKANKSRSDKRKSALLRIGACDLYQTFIPNYFKVLDEIGVLAKQNKALSDRLKEMMKEFKQQRECFKFDTFQGDEEMDSMSLLKRMLSQAIAQSVKEKKGRRYQDAVLLDFSLNIWILGGRRTYEILYDNMPGVFPSPTTVQRKLGKYNDSAVPGINMIV